MMYNENFIFHDTYVIHTHTHTQYGVCNILTIRSCHHFLKVENENSMMSKLIVYKTVKQKKNNSSTKALWILEEKTDVLCTGTKKKENS